MADLTILYDGGCPLCVREVRFLTRQDLRRNGAAPRLGFVDIDAPDYIPAQAGGIGYREAMGRIHAIEADGIVLRDVAVFRRAYHLVGLGWLYAPTGWPLVGPALDALYGIWAAWRLRLTGRPSLDQLCSLRGGSCNRLDHGASAAGAASASPIAAPAPAVAASQQPRGH